MLFKYAGRYSRWTVGFVAPALQIEGRGLDFTIKPFNDRGKALNKMIYPTLESQIHLFRVSMSLDGIISGQVIPSSELFTEEERSKPNPL